MQQTHIEKIQKLTAQLNNWRHEYYNLNAPTVTDAVYDRHIDELERLEQESGFSMSNSPTQSVGYKIVDGLGKAVHAAPLLSLKKTKDMNDILRFIGSHQVLVMQKLDGLTVKLEYNGGALIQASTRGDGETGEVITHNVSAIEGIPAKIPYQQRLTIVGEAYITKPVFESLRDILHDSSGNTYKNARNMAAGSVRCYDAGACAGRGVVFSPFSVIEGLGEDKETSMSKSMKLKELERLGFSPCKYFLSDKTVSELTISDIVANLRNMAERDGIPIDGIVVTYDGIPYSMSCGRTGHHFTDGIAFKFEDELYETILRGIEWKPSRSGELSPVALFDTVEIDGCDVSRASLHNLTYIHDLELVLGCRILVSKRNMIIPHVEENLDRGLFNARALIPAYCPCCSEPTRVHKSGKQNNRVIQILRCDNLGCSTQRLRQFVHFVSKKAMDIEGLSEATLAKLIDRGWLREFTDIYHIDRHAHELIRVEGFGVKSLQKLWASIQRSRNTTFERFVIALDIPMIGKTASRELCRYFNNSLNAFIAAVDSGFDFAVLSGFGEVMDQNIHIWFEIEENRKLWKEMRKIMSIQNNSAMTAAAADNPFAGRTIVVTGKLEHFTRQSINAKIEELGGKAGSAVSKNTDFLIAGDKSGSKLNKAREHGIRVLTEQQFLRMAESA